MFALKLQTYLQKAQTMEHQTGIEQAIAMFENSTTKLARAVGGNVLRQHIEHWKKVGKVPAEKAPDVEKVTGIPCEVLCPDTNWAVVRGIPAPQPNQETATLGA
jgi:DNA-binding transcriptional regulator YdaS (Cro superfamily)